MHFPIWVWARRDVVQALRQVFRTLVATVGIAVLAMAMDLLSWTWRIVFVSMFLVALAKNRLILGTIV